MAAPRVLVIDDDSNIREQLRIHLGAAGYEVEAAEDCVAAGHALLRRAPDLIITDVNMPHMDGFEFAAAIGSDASLCRIPVIFLTSEEEGQDRAKGVKAAGFVRKPVSADHLLAVVAKHLRA
ncbi:MAG: response regulator [Betaproteobacteria bacterium]